MTSSMIVPWIRVLKATISTLSQKFSLRFVLALKTSVDSRLSHCEKSDCSFSSRPTVQAEMVYECRIQNFQSNASSENQVRERRGGYITR